jgi:DNA-binding transcriptional ArsR family regulator
MFSAMGTEPRLRIMRVLLAAHPDGMIAGEIGAELDIPPSTLSHHLEKLKNEDLIKVRRESTFLWYSGPYRRPSGIARVPLCRVLHAQ